MRVVQILSLVAQLATVVGGTASICQTQVDPRNIDAATRSQWCTVQINTCGTLCGGVTDENTCDITSLCYSCTCTSNSSSPALQLYTSTIPFFVCEQTYSDCIAAGEDDPTAQKACRVTEEQNCGTLSPDTVSFSASALPSKSTVKPTPIPQMTSQTGTNTNTNTDELITSTTKTVTPTPTGTTTVWTTSTASSGSGSAGNGTIGSGSATGSLSSFMGVNGVSSSGGGGGGGGGSTTASTVSRTSSSKTVTGTAIGTSTPSTISEGGAERMRIGGAWVIWGVLMVGGGVGVMNL
ncbi:uncharacterized protein EAE97_007969 [Botrytis byssoidea]|uniref:DUF7707 domain-containing protein n=1 Tax=Botrytis byssoidea TaxID=139641 RepID=A0A9P5IHW5_9HELO|nr:uncharacterized protein EAE97_007969 [Botrytis byssoidea]KAF7936603.1 hypothetical protein EAE97_007969 [Botrytis byssoidea]